MKKNAFLMTLSFAFFVHLSYSALRTVSNNPGTVAQYNTVQAAIDASSPGDTIYVHGSPTIYANFNFNKHLVLIGPGFEPDKQLPHKATVSTIDINPGADNSEIQGFVISNITANSGVINNLRILRNSINGAFQINAAGNYSGLLLQNNYLAANIYGSSSGSYSNFIIENNIFDDQSSWAFSGFTNCTNVLINHNLFFGPTTTFVNIFINNCRFLTITNNIFVRKGAGNDVSFSTFNNNITYAPGVSDNNMIQPWLVNNNTNSGGNVSNQSPQIADQAAIDNSTAGMLSNYTIAAGPANNTGSDLKDMGLLFDAVGPLNWTNARNSRIPMVTLMNITTPTIAAGGNLNVEVQARKNN